MAAGGAAVSAVLGFVATGPVANAATLNFPAYTLQVAAEGSQPVAPRFFEGFSNTVNVAGSETAEYAMEQVGALYNNAGIFGCNQNSDKRTCNTSTEVLPSTDTYDNFDHDIVSNAQAVGSAAGVTELCASGADGLEPSEPSPIPSTWPYYTYPTPNANEGAAGIPIDLVRASASEADLSNHGVTVCSDLAQQAFATDAVVGLSFSPPSPDPDGAAVEDVAPATIDFSNTGGPGTATDTAWRVFCDSASDPLSITTWDQLYAAEGIPNPPSPDQPIVLWGPKNNSGTGATWYTFAGCGTTTGRILTNHLMTENDAQQLSLYAAQNASQTIPLNNTGCNATTTPACTGSTPTVPAAGSATATIDNCGGTGATTTGMGTSTYTAANEQCVDQELANSLFFMSYGYYVSHPYTAAATIPTAAVGSQPSYIDNASNLQVAGNASTIGGVTVSGAVLGQPGSGGVTGDPRATNASAVETGRDLWMDYLTDHVRASVAAFVNWVCDEGDEIAPKGLDLTTGVPIDTEITNDITAWGWGRLSCDGGTGAFGGKTSTYTSTITSVIIDPGPDNNE